LTPKAGSLLVVARSVVVGGAVIRAAEASRVQRMAVVGRRTKKRVIWVCRADDSSDERCYEGKKSGAMLDVLDGEVEGFWEFGVRV